ncbi:hypothetical protein J2O08_09650 [Elizabethkingia anophelis]|nr:hypothetical protein J2O08_09650 [Elizabethkingia anophelis]
MIIIYKVSAQKYIIVDNLKFATKKYTLDTKQLYNIDSKIILYNIFIDDKILLFSILPSNINEITHTNYEKLSKNIGKAVKENSIEKDMNWKKVEFKDIKDNIVSISDVLDNITSEWGVEITPEKKTFEYKLAKKDGDDYYITNNCLTEFFSIANSQYPIIAPYGTINISESKVTIKQMQESFKKQYPKSIFPLDVFGKSQSRGGDGIYTVRNYLSKGYKVKKDNAYQFWTLDSWWNIHGDNHHRGIDRFVYIPEKGIVGGSYDFYFRDPRGFRIADTVLWQNIINEKVMIAEELK